MPLLPPPTADQIKAALKAAGDSQLGAARRLEIDGSTMRRWISGARQMDSRTWSLYMLLTGQVSLSDLHPIEK
nr:hypothetical protein [uncultured Cohaesibacter sp.]